MSSKMARRKNAIGVLIALLLLVASLRARAADIGTLSKQPDEWFRSAEGKRILDNVLTWQNDNGGWWKAYDVKKARVVKDEPAKRDERFPAADQNLSGHVSTFDNKATWSELRLLSRAYRITKDEKYKDAFSKGLEFTFNAQYPNGGWPQRFPIEQNYGRQIPQHSPHRIFPSMNGTS